jgi:hypothetical protein
MALPGQGLARLESHVFHVNQSYGGTLGLRWLNFSFADFLTTPFANAVFRESRV